MNERWWRPVLRFPTPSSPHEHQDADGVLPETASDEALLRDLAAWTVPPASDESRERLFASARAELRRRALTASRRDSLRLTLPERPRRRWPFAAVFATVAVMAAVSLWWNTATLSAREALERAEQAEAGSWASAAEPIVHQRIELRATRGGVRQQVRWESWSNPAGSVRRAVTDQADERAVLTRYQETLARNGLDKGPPLSAAAFVRWQAQWPADAGEREHVARVEHVQTPDVGPAVRIHVHAPRSLMPGSIVDASLLVRASDWHSVEQVVHVRTGDGDIERFELVERHTSVMSRALLSDTFFDAAAGVPDKAASSGSGASTPARAVASSASEAELSDAEIGALFALHQVAADLGEQIDVVRRAQHIEVRGVVDTADRLRIIAGALSQIPHVRVAIVEAPRAAAGRRLARQPVTPPASPPSPSGSPVIIDAPGEPPLWRFIDAYLRAGRSETATSGDDAATATARARAINVFVQELTGESEGAVADAWALRRLTERYPLETRETLGAPSRRRLEAIAHDHLASIQGHIVRLQRSLTAVAMVARSRHDHIPPVERESEARHVDGPPRSASSRVFLEAIDVERQLARLVLPPERPVAQAEPDDTVLELLTRLLAVLTRVDHDLEGLME